MDNENDAQEPRGDKVDLGAIRQQTISVRQAMLALRDEYMREFDKCKAAINSKDEYIEFKRSHVEKSLERIQLALGEVEILLTLAHYLEYMEVDKMRVMMQLRFLHDENIWLKDEFANLHYRSSILDNLVTSTDAEMAHFNNIYQMRRNETTANKETITGIDNEKDDIEGDIPVHLKAVYNLILEYTSQGRYEVAIGLCRQALNEIKQKQGECYDMAVMLNILALVNRDKGDYKEAIAALEDTLRIREKLVGPEHPQVAATLNNLSVLLGKRGKFKDAEPICRRALKIREKHLGMNHADVAKQLNNLALIIQNVRKSEEIEDLYKRAIQIYQINNDCSEGNLVKTQNNLGAYYIRTQNYSKASVLLKGILNQYHEEQVNRQTAKGTKSLWQFAEAAAANERTVADATSKFQTFGVLTNATFRNTLRYLVTVYRRTGKDKEATILENYLEWSNKGGSGSGPVKPSHSMAQIPGVEDLPPSKAQSSPMEYSGSKALSPKTSPKTDGNDDGPAQQPKKKAGLLGMFKKG